MINTASDYLTVRPGYGAENYAETQVDTGMQDYTTAQEYNYVDAQSCTKPRKCMDTRQSLLARVNETGFAVDDANLYLDTHPCDQAALAYFQQASAMYHDAVNAYSAQFGPLMAVDCTDANYWSWISDPWPWEGGFN